MEAMRCEECGDVRWSFLGFASRAGETCELCGGEMMAERRKPHRGPMELLAERRDAAEREPGVHA